MEVTEGEAAGGEGTGTGEGGEVETPPGGGEGTGGEVETPPGGEGAGGEEEVPVEDEVPVEKEVPVEEEEEEPTFQPPNLPFLEVPPVVEEPVEEPTNYFKDTWSIDIQITSLNNLEEIVTNIVGDNNNNYLQGKIKLKYHYDCETHQLKIWTESKDADNGHIYKFRFTNMANIPNN
jgi:hypothetical protein